MMSKVESEARAAAGTARGGAKGKTKVVKEEIEGLLRTYTDGAVERLTDVVSEVPASADGCCASKDVVIDAAKPLWARLHVPKRVKGQRAGAPLVVYYHGGGFAVGSPAWSIYDAFLRRLACHCAVVVFAVAYRRAPEHRLPAAYDDAFAALTWLLSGGGASAAAEADVSRCVLAGDSAGANIAHHVALQADAAKIRGVVSIQPFFGGESSVASEQEAATTTTTTALPRAWAETFWRLCLPLGATRDHPYCNPVSGGREWQRLPPVLVCVSECDVVRDRGLMYHAALAPAHASLLRVAGVGHAFQLLRPSHPSVALLLDTIRGFILRCCGATNSH